MANVLVITNDARQVILMTEFESNPNWPRLTFKPAHEPPALFLDGRKVGEVDEAAGLAIAAAVDVFVGWTTEMLEVRCEACVLTIE